MGTLTRFLKLKLRPVQRCNPLFQTCWPVVPGGLRHPEFWLMSLAISSILLLNKVLTLMLITSMDLEKAEVGLKVPSESRTFTVLYLETSGTAVSMWFG